tara:strand:- start:1625 stop:2305 length:681 start_codon:yes stop_codon:yes gene_type:complete
MTSNYRYEKKLSIPTFFYDEINVSLKTIDLQLYKQYQDRRVNSIYLDTNDFDSYTDSNSGINERNKIRLRWYGKTLNNKIRLEIKSKEGNVGTKKIYSLNHFNTNNFGNLFELKESINHSNIPYDLKTYIMGCHPTLYCYYDREYFITRDERIRVTIDRNISYSNVYKDFLIYSVNSIKEKNMVLEIKYSSSNDFSDIDAILPFNIQPTRFSKYANGLDYLNQSHN